MLPSVLKGWRIPTLQIPIRAVKDVLPTMPRDNILTLVQRYLTTELPTSAIPPSQAVSVRPSSDLNLKGPEFLYFWEKLKKCFGFGAKKGGKEKGKSGKKTKKQTCKSKKGGKCANQKSTCMKKKNEDKCKPKQDEKPKPDCKMSEKKKEEKKAEPCKKDVKKAEPCKKKEVTKAGPNQKSTCMKKKNEDKCKPKQDEKPKPDCKMSEKKKEEKKAEPCKKDVKKAEPCKKKEQTKAGPCKKDVKKAEPCKKKEEKKADPCKKDDKKKEDPCKKKEDPCKKKEDPCKKKDDPCKKKDDPCKKKDEKKDDPCKKKEDPCKKKEDPCKKKDDPCKRKEDPCKKKDDPCKKKDEKKDDPCKKKEDPCKKKEDPCKKKEDPCKKKDDPCKKKDEKKDDPCKKKEDPCKKKEDPCKKKEDPCKKKDDPCKKKEDPCKKKDDPCKKKEDPCRKKGPCGDKFVSNESLSTDPILLFSVSETIRKKEEGEQRGTCKDPCAQGACDILPGQDEPCGSSVSWKVKVNPCRQRSSSGKRKGIPTPTACIVDTQNKQKEKLENPRDCGISAHPCGKKSCPNKCEVKKKKFSSMAESFDLCVYNYVNDLVNQAIDIPSIAVNFASQKASPVTQRPSTGGQSGVTGNTPAPGSVAQKVSGFVGKIKDLWNGPERASRQKEKQQPRINNKPVNTPGRSPSRYPTKQRCKGLDTELNGLSSVVGASQELPELATNGGFVYVQGQDDFEKCEDRVPPCPVEIETMPCPRLVEDCGKTKDELWSDIDESYGYERFPFKQELTRGNPLEVASLKPDDPYSNGHL